MKTQLRLNFQSVGNSANIGIYVAEKPVTVDGKDTTVLVQRGVPSTRFGVYVNVASGNLTKIHNDRSENLFVKQVTKAYDKLQDLENKYVGEIYKCLPKGQRDKFVKNMRSRGVTDARKDQAKSLDVGGDVKYEKGGKTDGHHTEKVSENPDKMTDPRTIEFKKQEDHIKYHQQNGY